MDPFHDRAAELARTDEDDYDGYDGYADDLAAATISDGFRPHRTFSPTASSSPPPPPPPQQHPVPTSRQSPPNSEQPGGVIDPFHDQEQSSSIAKHRRPSDPFALGDDGPRSLADAPPLRPQSPYRGPSAPSHPYQSYLQRTLSNATSSTAPLPMDSSSSGPHGPAHPYAQYYQSVPHGDETAQQQMAFDFPGAASIDPYRRQLGPDGEEMGGLIGPLGHTEELPPYSRYPDQITAPKPGPDPLFESQPFDAVPARRPVNGGGAGETGVATRDREPSAVEEDLEPMRSRTPTESLHEINTAARGTSEKSPLNKWQRRAKKKLCGIVPCWAIFLVMISVVAVALTLGAVIGTVLFHGHKGHREFGYPDDVFDNMVIPSDIAPLSQYPRGLSPPIIGRWTLPFGTADQQPNDCISDPSQASAWSCDLSKWAHSITVLKTLSRNATRNYNISLTPANTAQPLAWGMQPFFNISYPMMLVTEIFDPSSGPAWWTTFDYVKSVLLPADSLPGIKKLKRSSSRDFILPPPPPPPKHDVNAGPKDGDLGWLCYWPEVNLEVFVYPDQRLQATTTASSQRPLGTGTAINEPSMSTGTAISHPSRGTATAILEASATAVAPVQAPSFVNGGVAIYPNAVKVLERRTAASSPAYCQQIQITDNAHDYRYVRGDDNSGIEVHIALQAPLVAVGHQRAAGADDRGGHGLQGRAAPDPSDCACLWWV